MKNKNSFTIAERASKMTFPRIKEIDNRGKRTVADIAKVAKANSDRSVFEVARAEIRIERKVKKIKQNRRSNTL